VVTGVAGVGGVAGVQVLPDRHLERIPLWRFASADRVLLMQMQFDSRLTKALDASLAAALARLTNFTIIHREGSEFCLLGCASRS